MKNNKAINSSANGSLEEFAKYVSPAAVILAVDKKTGREVCIYGRKALEEIVRSGVAQKLPVTRIPVDFATEQLECALAVVLMVKGSYEWNGEVHRRN